MEPLDIVRQRQWRQGLAGDLPTFATPAEAVGRLLAVQGQEYAEAKWAVGRRVRGATDAAIEAALASGEVLRTHALRPTWHLIAAADLRWLMRLTAPRVHAGNKSRYRDLGLDAAVLSRGHEVIARALAGGPPLTRRELGEALEADGISVEGQRLNHLVMHAELELVVCSGPVRGKQQTYALVDERLPAESGPPLDRETAVAELVLRYFTSHGPATLRDFTWWSSLTAADARAGLERASDALASWVDGEGRTWIGPPEADRATAAPALLLSTFDETVVAYRDLRGVLAGGDDPSAALLSRPVTVDGRTVGTWRRTLRRADVAVDVELTAPLEPAQARALDAEVERFGEFVGRPARLAVVPTSR